MALKEPDPPSLLSREGVGQADPEKASWRLRKLLMFGNGIWAVRYHVTAAEGTGRQGEPSNCWGGVAFESPFHGTRRQSGQKAPWLLRPRWRGRGDGVAGLGGPGQSNVLAAAQRIKSKRDTWCRSGLDPGGSSWLEAGRRGWAKEGSAALRFPRHFLQ